MCYNEPMQKKIDRDTLYDLDGVADLLGLSPHSIRRLIDRGELPRNKVGRRLMWTGADILNSFASLPSQKNFEELRKQAEKKK